MKVMEQIGNGRDKVMVQAGKRKKEFYSELERLHALIYSAKEWVTSTVLVETKGEVSPDKASIAATVTDAPEREMALAGGVLGETNSEVSPDAVSVAATLSDVWALEKETALIDGILGKTEGEVSPEAAPMVMALSSPLPSTTVTAAPEKETATTSSVLGELLVDETKTVFSPGAALIAAIKYAPEKEKAMGEIYQKTAALIALAASDVSPHAKKEPLGAE